MELPMSGRRIHELAHGTTRCVMPQWPVVLSWSMEKQQNTAAHLSISKKTLGRTVLKRYIRVLYKQNYCRINHDVWEVLIIGAKKSVIGFLNWHKLVWQSSAAGLGSTRCWVHRGLVHVVGAQVLEGGRGGSRTLNNAPFILEGGIIPSNQVYFLTICERH